MSSTTPSATRNSLSLARPPGFKSPILLRRLSSSYARALCLGGSCATGTPRSEASTGNLADQIDRYRELKGRCYLDPDRGRHPDNGRNGPGRLRQVG
jgi:hypothetical protein